VICFGIGNGVGIGDGVGGIDGISVGIGDSSSGGSGGGSGGGGSSGNSGGGSGSGVGGNGGSGGIGIGSVGGSSGGIGIGGVGVGPGLLEEKERKRAEKNQQMFSTETMERVAGFMQIKPINRANFSQTRSNASAILKNTHTTTGQQSLRLVTSAEVESNLLQACQEFQRLCMRLREMLLNHTIFSETAFTENPFKNSLFGSNKSATLLRLYKETNSNSTCLFICINEIKQSL
jgi:hypothetical protein